MRKILLAVGLLTCVFAAPVAAQDSFSAYTRTDNGNCTVLEEEMDPAYYGYAVCPGYDGWVLHVDGGEHGQRSTFRMDAVPIPEDQKPTVFNYPFSQGNFGSFYSVIEWRTRGEGGPAYAAIHRYSGVRPIEGGLSWRQVSTLTVSALRAAEAGGTCMVAHIEASTLNHANEIARDAADRIAPTFTCGTDRALLINADYPDVDAAINGRSYDR